MVAVMLAHPETELSERCQAVVMALSLSDPAGPAAYCLTSKREAAGMKKRADRATKSGRPTGIGAVATEQA